MHPHQTTPRHAQLFELLRQESLGEHTASRLRARGFARAQLDRQEATELRAMAINSWN